MGKVRKIEKFETTDKSLFDNYNDAETHQKQIDKVDDIKELLGGDSRKISDDTSFSNGEGIYIISDKNFKEANEKINELKREFDVEDYNIRGRMLSEHQYLGKISGTMGCIFKNNKDQIVRVGQPYFALHPEELGTRIYN